MMLNLICNVIWFVLGGLVMGLAWCMNGLIAFITIVGIPWGRSCFVIAGFSFFPFGRAAIRRDVLTGRDDIGTGALGSLGNVIWFIFAGLWLAIGHVLSGIACCCTLIGIPFGIQHFKLARISLAPIGLTVVPNDVARAAV